MIPFHDDNPTRTFPWVTVALVGLNVLVFVNVQRLPPPRQVAVSVQRGFVPARVEGLRRNRPVTVRIPVQAGQDPWNPRRVLVRHQTIRLEPVPRQVLASLVTCMFLHAGWGHLIGNMWFLWLFGNNVEDRLGHLVYLFFYLGGGALATAAHWAGDPLSTVPVIGASGAVSAVLGAYAVTWPWARIHTLVPLIFIFTIIDLPALVVLGLWFAWQLLQAVGATQAGLDGGVAWWAHVGGFAAGLLIMPLVRTLTDREELRRQSRALARGWEED